MTPAGRTGEVAPVVSSGPRARLVLATWVLVAAATATLLHSTSQRPHASALAEGEGGTAAASQVQLPPRQAAAQFPATDVATFSTISRDTLARLESGDQAGATARIADLETAWDDAQPRLEALDPTGWGVLDGQIDVVLHQLRATNPDPGAERAALSTLLTSLG